MNIDAREAEKVTSLSVGEAAVFSEGDEGPYHVKVPYSKIEAKKGEKKKEEEAIRKAMAGLSDAKSLAPYEACKSYCEAICRYKGIGSELSSKNIYKKQIPILTLAIVDNLTSAESMLLQIFEMGGDEGDRAKDPKGVKICALIQAAETYFEELGSGYNWPYESVEKVKEAFLDFTIDALTKYMASPVEFNISSIDEDKIQRLRDIYSDACRGRQPTQYCSDICEDELCLYRFSLKEALADDYYSGRFVKIIEEGGEEMWSILNELCREAAQGAVLPDASEDATRKIALCYALHKCNSMKSFSRRHVETVMRSLIDHNRVEESRSIEGG
jgi:hypothetical protein